MEATWEKAMRAQPSGSTNQSEPLKPVHAPSKSRRNWNGTLNGNFAAEHFAGLVGQLQVPVTWECCAVDVERDEGSLRGQFVGSGSELVHGSSFVDFIEHRSIDHSASGADRVVS